MIEVTRTGPDRVYITVSGKIDGKAMEDGLDAFIDASKDIENGKLFYVITDFRLPDASALAVEFKRLPGLFSLIGRFRKAAVISDAAWLRKIAEVEAFLIPGITIKTFEPGEETAAESWLAV
ncbi:MAG: STAS/SEC14 domain-containing protein [Nitratireductor sp.]|nr:STAS/SEC14 domain-containing protein [Nitratireductor sp.]MCC0020600.1 STAS/SEC14 domain-containing protein [Nitratireductor sp.]